MPKGMLDFIDDVPPNVLDELTRRFEELTRLEKDQTQMGTAIPQLYGSLSKFVANPSSVSVETYKRMLDTDETIGAGVDFLIMAMCARMGTYKHKSKEITDFVNQALGQMETSWHQNLSEMFSAEWAGFSGTEKVWQYDSNFGGMPAYRPKKLVTYPPLTLIFAVNRNGDILPDGIFQYQRYHNSLYHSGTPGGSRSGDLDGFRPDLYASVGDFPYPIRVAADLSYMTVKIPQHKMIHLTSSSTGNFANPYGRSLLRRAYKNWVAKDAFLKMWVVAADRKGTPLLVGFADASATVDKKGEADGNQNSDTGTAPNMMAAALRTIHNSSFVVLPGKKGEVYDIEAVAIQGDMNVFKDGTQYFNTAMLRALLIPPLIMGGDGGGSFSLGQEHHKLFNKIVDGKLKPYKQGITQQFIRPMIGYNFPRAAWEKDGLGEFVLEEYDTELMEKLANVFGNITDKGYMSAEDQADMDTVRGKLGLPDKKVAQVLNIPGMGMGAGQGTGGAEDAEAQLEAQRRAKLGLPQAEPLVVNDQQKNPLDPAKPAPVDNTPPGANDDKSQDGDEDVPTF